MIDLTGKTFGRWYVIGEISHNRPYNARKWKCRCSCGTLANVWQASLRSRRSVSCGCYMIESKTKHGDSRTRLYECWRAMHRRCTDPKTNTYPFYGGKGISVCKAWKKYEVFRHWSLANGYNDILTIDRKKSNKSYSPANCRWVNWTVQSRNRPKKSGTSSQYIGVSWNTADKKWRAAITINNRVKQLGGFNSELVAAKIRDKYIIDNSLQDYVMNF